MADAILLDHYTLPAKGAVRLQIDCSFEIQVTATEARQKVDGWLLDEVSITIGAGEPLLVVDGATAVWRVPAIFTATHLGEVGVAGTVDVDVETGLLSNTAACKKAILQGAQVLAKKMPLYKPPTTTPAAALAHGLKPTIKQPQGDPREILAAGS